MNNLRVPVLIGLLLTAVIVAASASGEAETDPVFDPSRPGWQEVAIRPGFDRVRRSDTRLFDVYLKGFAGRTKEHLDVLTRDFFPLSLELYAAAGVEFTLKREKSGGWRATTGVLKEKTTLSLARAVVYQKKDYGDNRLYTYKVTSYGKQLPNWRGSFQKRYVFRGVWNMNAAALPADGNIDWVVMRALERMAQELGPETEPSLLAGRVYLLEFRFLYVSRDRLGVYCRLAVEGP